MNSEIDPIAEHGPYDLTKTGVFERESATYDQWQAAIMWCQDVEKASPFWVGDLLLLGDKFGEEASQVLEASGYAEQTARNTKHVCKVIPPERRRQNLSFALHQEVAAVPDVDEQEKWLDKCEQEDLTRDQLRVQMKLAKAESTGSSVELWLHVRCDSMEQQSLLADRLKLEGFLVKVDAKTTEAVAV